MELDSSRGSADDAASLRGPPVRTISQLKTKARSNDRAFFYLSLSKGPLHAAFDTSSSLSISSVPIR